MYEFRGEELPGELQESIDAYVESGRPMGGFLTAIAENDLRGACNKASEENARKLHVIVAYFYNECPSGCWGFKGATAEWAEKMRARHPRRESYETTDHGDSVWPK